MRSRGAGLGLLLAAACFASSGAAAAQEAQPGQPIVSAQDLTIYPPAGRGAEFRFLPDGDFEPFDRVIVLSAALGESRAYLLQLAQGKDSEEAAPAASYLIDKRRPRAPRCSPGTGLYRDAIRPALTSDKGASIFWALLGPSGAVPAFAELSEGSRPSLEPPAAGSATYTLVAYAVDGAGNRSYPSRFVFRLAEPGLQTASPAADSWAIASDPSLPVPAVEIGRGYATITAELPAGSVFLLDIAPPAPPSALDDFERVASQEGTATLRVPCPYGWTGELSCYYGLLKEGQASFNPQPLSIRLSNPVEADLAPPVPEGPVLEADPAGRGAFLLFPSYDGKIFVSLDDGESLPYAEPLTVPKGRRSVKVSWYGEDGSGLRTAECSTSFALPEFVPEGELVGIADGASTAKDVTLRPSSKAVLRYEIRLDGSIPPEPGVSSPLLGDSLSLSCPAGEERAVVIRYRAFSGDLGGEGRVLRFFLDKKPPEPPRVLDLATARSDKSLSFRLAPGSGGRDVFASVTADDGPASFAPVKGAIELPGSDSAPVVYTVRAYDLDAAGNKSQEMKSLVVVVDRASVYAAGDGSGPGPGDGSPDRPFKSLDAAAAAASALGRHTINLRGQVESRSPLALASDLSLVGGYDAQWAKDPSAFAAVRLVLPPSGPAWTVAGSSLAIRKVDLDIEGPGTGAAIAMRGGSLSIEDSTIDLGSDSDILLASASAARIDLRGSRIRATQAMSCSLLSAADCDVRVASCSVAAAQGVHIFGGFDMDRGSLSISESVLESRADLGLSLFSLRSTSLLVDRCLIRAEGGSGFLRLGSFGAASGEVRNSKILLSWKGGGTLFEGSVSGPAFRFDTIVCDSEKGSLRFFDAKGWKPEIWNSILDCSAPGSELLRSDSAPIQGELAADCLWGFDLLLAGAAQVKDLASLNAINSGSEEYGSRPIIVEPPEKSFGPGSKGLSGLRPDSACVGAAIPIEGVALDFGGTARPAPGKPGPDIGADELVY